MKLSENDLSKIKTYIGFALRSRTAVIGTDNLLSARRTPLYLLDTRLSDNAKEKLTRHAEENGAKLFFLEKLDALTSKDGVKAVGIKNKSLAEAIINVINNQSN